MRIEVAGIPAPQGSKRHVGNGRMVESSKAVGPWREAVRAETQRMIEAVNEWYLPGQAVQVEISFRLPRPRSHFGTGRNAGRVRPSAPHWPAGKPDVDKLARAVLDGLTAGGAFTDDAQVCCLWAAKVYGDKPGCVIFVNERGD